MSGRRHKKKNSTSNDNGGNKRKKSPTGNDDGKSGKRKKKRSTSEGNKRKKKTTDDVDPVSRRTTRGHPIFDTSGSGKIPKNLASHLTAGAGEEQGAKTSGSNDGEFFSN